MFKSFENMMKYSQMSTLTHSNGVVKLAQKQPRRQKGVS